MSKSLGYRAITVFDSQVRFCVRQLETEIYIFDHVIKVPNWDIKGVREPFYREEYVSVPVEEYLRSVVAQEELVEYGIKASDVKRYILERRKYFSELIEDNFANIPLE